MKIEGFDIPALKVLQPVRQHTFLYVLGNINELVRMLSENKIINLMIEEPSLDEIFMHYYKL